MYVPRKKYAKRLSRKDIKDFIFYNYVHLSSRAKKEIFQFLNKFLTTILKNYAVSAYKNLLKQKS